MKAITVFDWVIVTLLLLLFFMPPAIIGYLLAQVIP